jgi:hypothetical protein
MVEKQLFYSYIGSNLVALIMLALSWRWKTAGRLSFVLLFLWAGLYNFWTAFVRPEEYVSLVRLAYSSFVLRFFLQHTTAVVAAIAIGQLAIGILVSLRGSAVKLGLLGAVVFLLGMAPLAAADGFSARLIKACAALLLLRFTYSSMLWSELARLLRRHPHAHAHSAP